MKKSVAVAAGLFLLAACPAFAASVEVVLPEGVKEVTTAELKGWFDQKKRFTLVNSLSPLEFTQTKISGSINLPYDHLLSGESTLPPDKGATLVFYCQGPR